MFINPSHDILCSATVKGIHPDTPPENGASDRLSELLARVANLRRGSTIDRPTKFNAAGERHANAVAARDSAVHGGHEQSQPTRPILSPSTESHS